MRAASTYTNAFPVPDPLHAATLSKIQVQRPGERDDCAQWLDLIMACRHTMRFADETPLASIHAPWRAASQVATSETETHDVPAVGLVFNSVVGFQSLEPSDNVVSILWLQRVFDARIIRCKTCVLFNSAKDLRWQPLSDAHAIQQSKDILRNWLELPDFCRDETFLGEGDVGQRWNDIQTNDYLNTTVPNLRTWIIGAMEGACYSLAQLLLRTWTTRYIDSQMHDCMIAKKKADDAEFIQQKVQSTLEKFKKWRRKAVTASETYIGAAADIQDTVTDTTVGLAGLFVAFSGSRPVPLYLRPESHDEEDQEILLNFFATCTDLIVLGEGQRLCIALVPDPPHPELATWSNTARFRDECIQALDRPALGGLFVAVARMLGRQQQPPPPPREDTTAALFRHAFCAQEGDYSARTALLALEAVSYDSPEWNAVAWSPATPGALPNWVACPSLRIGSDLPLLCIESNLQRLVEGHGKRLRMPPPRESWTARFLRRITGGASRRYVPVEETRSQVQQTFDAKLREMLLADVGADQFFNLDELSKTAGFMRLTAERVILSRNEDGAYSPGGRLLVMRARDGMVPTTRNATIRAANAGLDIVGSDQGAKKAMRKMIDFVDIAMLGAAGRGKVISPAYGHPTGRLRHLFDEAIESLETKFRDAIERLSEMVQVHTGKLKAQMVDYLLGTAKSGEFRDVDALVRLIDDCRKEKIPWVSQPIPYSRRNLHPSLLDGKVLECFLVANACRHDLMELKRQALVLFMGALTSRITQIKAAIAYLDEEAKTRKADAEEGTKTPRFLEMRELTRQNYANNRPSPLAANLPSILARKAKHAGEDFRESLPAAYSQHLVDSQTLYGLAASMTREQVSAEGVGIIPRLFKNLQELHLQAPAAAEQIWCEPFLNDLPEILVKGSDMDPWDAMQRIVKNSILQVAAAIQALVTDLEDVSAIHGLSPDNQDIWKAEPLFNDATQNFVVQQCDLVQITIGTDFVQSRNYADARYHAYLCLVRIDAMRNQLVDRIAYWRGIQSGLADNHDTEIITALRQQEPGSDAGASATWFAAFYANRPGSYINGGNLHSRPGEALPLYLPHELLYACAVRLVGDDPNETNPAMHDEGQVARGRGTNVTLECSAWAAKLAAWILVPVPAIVLGNYARTTRGFGSISRWLFDRSGVGGRGLVASYIARARGANDATSGSLQRSAWSVMLQSSRSEVHAIRGELLGGASVSLRTDQLWQEWLRGRTDVDYGDRRAFEFANGVQINAMDQYIRGDMLPLELTWPAYLNDALLTMSAFAVVGAGSVFLIRAICRVSGTRDYRWADEYNGMVNAMVQIPWLGAAFLSTSLGAGRAIQSLPLSLLSAIWTGGIRAWEHATANWTDYVFSFSGLLNTAKLAVALIALYWGAWLMYRTWKMFACLRGIWPCCRRRDRRRAPAVRIQRQRIVDPPDNEPNSRHYWQPWALGATALLLVAVGLFAPNAIPYFMLKPAFNIGGLIVYKTLHSWIRDRIDEIRAEIPPALQYAERAGESETDVQGPSAPKRIRKAERDLLKKHGNPVLSILANIYDDTQVWPALALTVLSIMNIGLSSHAFPGLPQIQTLTNSLAIVT